MCMKQNWDQTSGFFDFKKAITAADGIRHTFTLQRGVEMNSDQWDHIIYHLIKDALLEPFSIILGPNNRPYLQVYVPSKEEIQSMQDDNDGIKVNATKSPLNQNTKNDDVIAYKNFASVCTNAVENYAGIALYSSKDQREPNMTIKFGALYAFLQYQDMGGPSQISDNMITAIKTNPQNPRQAIADEDNGSYKEGEPSEEVFNSFLRTLITQELRRIINNGQLQIQFLLREQYMYVLRHMIVVKPFEKISDQSRINHIMQNLTWYMPLYLPLAYIDEDGYINLYN
jgi:hypothetical protein